MSVLCGHNPESTLGILNCTTSKSTTTLAACARMVPLALPSLLNVEGENSDARTHIQRLVFPNASKTPRRGPKSIHAQGRQSCLECWQRKATCSGYHTGKSTHTGLQRSSSSASETSPSSALGDMFGEVSLLSRSCVLEKKCAASHRASKSSARSTSHLHSAYTQVSRRAQQRDNRTDQQETQRLTRNHRLLVVGRRLPAYFPKLYCRSYRRNGEENRNVIARNSSLQTGGRLNLEEPQHHCRQENLQG